MFRKLLGLLAFLLAVTLAVVGLNSGGSVTPPTRGFVPHACVPAVGQGHIGACVPGRATGALTKPGLAGPARYFPDVYEGTGTVDWQGAKARGLTGAVVKAYEENYQQDGQFARNWSQLRSLGLWHAAYLFARAGNCTVEADTYVNIVRSVGGWDALAGPPIIDAEVPGAGIVPCLAARIRADTGISAIVTYTAPGTWPGGGAGGTRLWVATYGSGYGSVPGFGSPVAWQFTNGHIGPDPHGVYGLQNGDVSIDFGLQTMLAHPAPPRVRCFGPHAQLHLAYCKTIRARVHHAEVNLSYLQFHTTFNVGCLRRFPTKKHGHYVRWGPNYRKSFCTRVFNLEHADTAYIQANKY